MSGISRSIARPVARPISSPLAGGGGGVVYPAWSPGTYAMGDRVRHSGANWISTADDNTGEPGVSGWDEI